MTIEELREACNMGRYVILHLPPPKSRRLFSKRGPRGEVICGRSAGQTVRFLSAAVLRYLDKDGLPDALRQFPKDDSAGRGNHIVLYPHECEELKR